MATLNKINGLISKIIYAIAGLILASMVVITFWQVIVRLTKGSLPWSEEAARYLQVYLTFLGVSVGVRHNELISVEALFDGLPKALKNVVQVIIYIVMAVVLGVLIVYGWRLVQTALLQSSPVMGIKMGYVYFAVVFGSVLMFIHNLINLINHVTGYQSPDSQSTARIEVQG